MQGHGRIIAPDFCVAHREANSGLSTLNRTKSILSIYHQQRQLQKQRGMCLNDTYPFCQQPLSGNCHSICFSKPVLWTATPRWVLCLLVPEVGLPSALLQCRRQPGELKKRPPDAFLPLGPFPSSPTSSHATNKAPQGGCFVCWCRKWDSNPHVVANNGF